MAWTSGGPLLNVEDLLEDLKHEPGAESFSGSGALRSLESGEEQSLHSVFKRTYKEMRTALGKPGYDWLGPTERLCSGLAAADELVSRSQDNLSSLLQNVKQLQAAVDRAKRSLERIA